MASVVQPRTGPWLWVDSDFRYHGPGTGANWVDWEFTGLTPEKHHRVSATWFTVPNQASNAPYSIYGGLSPNAADLPEITVRADQRYLPDDCQYSGASWENLAVVQVPAGETSLTVRLSPGALPPEGGTTNALRTSDLRSAFRTAKALWTITGLTATEQTRLSTVDVQVVDLSSNMLGWTTADATMVWIDTNAAGYGWNLEEYEGRSTKDEHGLASSIPHSDFRNRLALRSPHSTLRFHPTSNAPQSAFKITDSLFARMDDRAESADDEDRLSNERTITVVATLARAWNFRRLATAATVELDTCFPHVAKRSE